MFLIARKNLFYEKTRFLISVSGMAFSVLLIIVLWGLYLDWNKRVSSYLISVPGDIWVRQEGASDMFHSLSLLPRDLKSQIEQAEGVKEVNEFLGGKASFKIRDAKDGDEKSLYLIGFDTDKMIGAPLRVLKGKTIPDLGEIIIDRVFTQKNQLEIGDLLHIKGREFKIVGISEGGNMLIYQYAFIKQEELREMYNFSGLTGYFLVKTKESYNQGEVIKNIEKIGPQVDAVTRERFIQDNHKVIAEAFLPIIYTLSLIGMLVGVAVIGLTTYTATIEKSREFGILKAIGMENRTLYKIVFIQSLISAILGYIFGVSMAYIVAYLANIYQPAFTASIEPFNLLMALAVSVLMGIVASYIPVRKIANIDPALVFKT